MDGKHENSKMNSKVNNNECKQSNENFLEKISNALCMISFGSGLRKKAN